jgi:hypothetical protein
MKHLLLVVMLFTATAVILAPVGFHVNSRSVNTAATLADGSGSPVPPLPLMFDGSGSPVPPLPL